MKSLSKSCYFRPCMRIRERNVYLNSFLKRLCFTGGRSEEEGLREKYVSRFFISVRWLGSSGIMNMIDAHIAYRVVHNLGVENFLLLWDF